MEHPNSEPRAFFKSWAIPGPGVPGGIEAAEGESLDALSGFFKIFQYENGHRFSTDDVLTAWYATSHCPCARRVLDLGSGIGSVGMITAWRLPGAELKTIEAQEISVKLARKSVIYNGLAHRYEIRKGDFRDPLLLKSEERFDVITASPPYFPQGTGLQAEHPQKAACRFELRGSIADYAQTASLHLAPGGIFTAVFVAQQKQRLYDALEKANLSLVRQREVIFREGEMPLLILITANLTQDLPEKFRNAPWTDPPLTIRLRDGSIHPEYSAIKLTVGFPP